MEGSNNMTLPDIKILDEKDKTLRKKSMEVTFPLSKEDKKLINDAITYLTMSQIEKYYEKYNLRPGMGLAFIQLGIPKNIFVIVEEVDKEKFENYVDINPKLISHSEELVFVGDEEKDRETAQNAGCKFIRINRNGADGVPNLLALLEVLG